MNLEDIKRRLTTWDDWGRPLFYTVVIGLTGFYIFFGADADLVDREFDRCNSKTDLFVSNTYGYSLCLPKEWNGKYGIVPSDHRIDFVYTNGSSTPVLLFAIKSMPYAYWDLVPAARGTWDLIASDENRVFLALNYRGDDPNTNSEEYRALAASIPQIEQTIALSDYKSIDEVIEDNLTRLGVKPHGGRTFAAYEILGRDELEDGAYKYYVWFFSQEYYENSGRVVAGAEMSVPVSLSIVEKNSVVTLPAFEAPRGDKFFEDVKRIFPERIAQSEWFNPDLEYLNAHVDVLKVISASKAKKFYGDRFPNPDGSPTSFLPL